MGPTFRQMLLPILCLLMVAACSSTPDTDQAAQNVLKSGSAAESSAGSTRVTPAISGSQMGDSEASNVTAQADRTTSSTAQVSQKAFDFAGTVEKTGEAYTKMVGADPFVVALQGQLARADLAPEERTKLLDSLQKHLADLRQSLQAAGGDLSALSSLTVINNVTHGGNAGHETKPLTPEEASAAATGLPKVIEAAREKKP